MVYLLCGAGRGAGGGMAKFSILSLHQVFLVDAFINNQCNGQNP